MSERSRLFRGDREDSRAVAPVVASVLLFGILIIFLSMYQASVIPQSNEQTEFEHSQTVKANLLDLNDAVHASASDGVERTVAVQTGTLYEPRTLFVNPPPATGRLHTEGGDGGNVTVAIEGANHTRNTNVGQYWDGDTVIFDTGTVVYTPDYHRYTSAPTTVIEHGVIYNADGDSAVPLTEQSIVSGSRISLVLIEGDLDETGLRTSVSVTSVSVDENTVTVRNDSSPITVELSTKLPESAWKGLLEDQFVENGGHVRNVSVTEETGPYDTVQIELESNVTYRLRIGKVSLGQDASEAKPHHITRKTANYTYVPSGGRRVVRFEVRDRYGNPVSGARVDALLEYDRGTLTPIATNRTGTDGVVKYLYEAVDADTTALVNATTAMGELNGTNVALTVGAGGLLEPAPAEGTAVFAQSSALYTKAFNQSKTDMSFSDVAVTGPMRIDIDGDGKADIPVSTSGNDLYLVSPNESSTRLLSSGVASAPSRLAVGTWNGSENSVFFAGSSGSAIYRVDGDGNKHQVADPGGTNGVGGFGDLTGDGKDELVYLDGSNNLYYLSSDGSTTSIGKSVGSSNGIGIGNPRDFDGDGTARIPIVDGNNKVALVAADGTKTQIASNAMKSQVAALDWTGDGTVEILFVNTSGNLRYVEDVEGSPTVKDVGDGTVSADDTTGVA